MVAKFNKQHTQHRIFEDAPRTGNHRSSTLGPIGYWNRALVSERIIKSKYDSYPFDSRVYSSVQLAPLGQTRPWYDQAVLSVEVTIDMPGAVAWKLSFNVWLFALYIASRTKEKISSAGILTDARIMCSSVTSNSTGTNLRTSGQSKSEDRKYDG